MEKYKEILEKWQSWSIKSIQSLEKYLDSFKILFAYHSGRIENEDVTYNDTREIFENGKVNQYSGNPKALFEQQNQKLCYAYLNEKIVDKEELSIPLIKEIHRILTSGTYDERRYVDNQERPGEFKKHDYVTGIHEVGSDASDVENDLAELIKEINEFGQKNPLRAAAYFHASFEYIHPFADGNGRVGRTLLNYWLMINNYPPLIIYDEDKNRYYEALQQFDEIESIDLLEEFLKEETIKTWTKKEKDTRHKISNFL